MGKESKKGSDFYKSKGLRPITIHLPPAIHSKLLKLAKKEERSIQVTARRVLAEALK